MQTNITGSFSSIDWDGDGYYDNENDCLWTLTALEDMHIEVKILSMDIENEYACTFDFLEVCLIADKSTSSLTQLWPILLLCIYGECRVWRNGHVWNVNDDNWLQ